MARGDLNRRQLPQAALSVGGELADRFDVVAQEFEAIGSLGIRGIDVQDAAPTAEFAGDFNRLHALEAALDQPFGKIFERYFLADAHLFSLLGKLVAVGDRLQQGLHGGQEKARRGIVLELAQQAQALASDLVDHGLGTGQGVPGGEDVGAHAGEAGEVVGPGIEVARVGQDDEQGLGRP